MDFIFLYIFIFNGCVIFFCENNHKCVNFVASFFSYFHSLSIKISHTDVKIAITKLTLFLNLALKCYNNL